MTSEQAQDWFSKNKKWLAKWLKNTRPSKSPYFQVFRRSREEPWDGRLAHSLRPLGVARAKSKMVQLLTDEIKDEYMSMTLFALVFGCKNRHTVDFGEYKETTRTISGFFEQTGRLPTRKDKVILYEINVEPQPIISDGYDSLLVKFDQRFARLRILGPA